jgi:hypothetical protein
MIAHTAPSVTFGTDPIAASLRSTFRCAGPAPARHPQNTAAGARRALDIDRLYPSLSVATAPLNIVDELYRGLAAAVATLRFRITSL